MIGKTLGHYRIVEKIGAGGMGEVYRAHDEQLDRDVALKVLPAGMIADDSARRQFRKEARALAKLNHPNVETVFEFSSQDGVSFLAMELIPGHSLSQKLMEGPLSEEEIVRLGMQFSEGLAAAHEHGIVHRDLKPSNLFVTPDARLKILDFGLAKLIHPELTSDVTQTIATQTGTISGTVPYMPPEQLRGEPSDERGDIYAFGAVLYEMATGQRPFPQTQAPQLMGAILHQAPAPPRSLSHGISPGLDSVILKCLEKDPTRRYQHAREILHDLEAATAPTRVGRHRIAETGYPKWLIATVAALLLAIGFGVSIPSIRDALSRRSSITMTPRTSGSGSAIKYLVILPFRVLGNQSALKYEADGVVDALSAKLFQLKDVHLASPSAVEKVNSNDSLEKIARELGVNLIVQGKIEGAGDKIEIALSLSDTSGRLLWTHGFPGVRQDLLTIEDEIYKRLSDALELKVTDDELARGATRLTSDVEAYELYLKGRSLLRAQRDPKTVSAAMGLYDQALKKDPRFALAYAGLADCYLYTYDAKKERAWVERALGAAQQAQGLNDELPEAHIALGSVFNVSGKTGEAIAELKRALELAPSSDQVYRQLANTYLAAGRADDAIQTYKKAIEINPYYWQSHNQLGAAYFKLGQNENALNAYRRVTELAPDRPYGYANMGEVYYRLEEWDESISALQKAIRLEPNSLYYSNIGVIYFFRGRHAEAAQMFEKAVELSPNDHLQVANLADAYRALGQREKAIATYDRAIKLAYESYQVNPRNAGTLGSLALYNAKKGDLKRASNFIGRARAIDQSDNELIYDEAVISALAGQQAKALKSLREALQKGYPAKEAENDPDLASLRSSQEFQKLVAEHKIPQ